MIRKREGWLATKVGQEFLMMSVETGAYVGLNDVGSRVWELIDTPKNITELCADLAKEFQVTPEDCRGEVESFLAELTKLGAISRLD